MEITENKIRQYLLGNLPEEEAEKIDLRIISDKNLEESLYLAEERLMEDHLEKTLSISDLKLFHENFLTSRERKSELKHLAQLKTYAQKKGDQREESASSQRITNSDSFFQKLKGFFGFNIPLVASLSVLIVLGLLMGVFFYNRSESEIAHLDQKELSDISEYKDLSNLNLISGAFRDAPSASILAKDKLTENVLFRLALPSGITTETFFDIQIRDEQKPIATLKHVRPYSNPNGREIRLVVPSSVLKKGNYKIEAVPENAQNDLVSYSFTIQ